MRHRAPPEGRAGLVTKCRLLLSGHDLYRLLLRGERGRGFTELLLVGGRVQCGLLLSGHDLYWLLQRGERGKRGRC